MEIILNRNDIEDIVKSYKTKDATFCLRSFINETNQKKCNFFIDGKECNVVFYLKKKTINIMPIGKNVEASSKLIDYICKKGFDPKTKTNTYIFEVKDFNVNELLDFISNECNELINYTITNNIYRFKGYNEDELVLTIYPNKIMIQSKPFFVYGIISTYFASIDSISFDKIVEMNNSFTEMNLPSTIIREEMVEKLGNAYNYLDEALKKSISGSLTMLKSKNICEDYTGHVAGVFKGLEGYFKKILTRKYNYRITRNQTFSMFYVDPISNLCEIDNNSIIPFNCKDHLKKLYNLYSSKRNIYLHTTIDPALTKIVETRNEAIEISEEILKEINDSYIIFF